MSLCGLMGANRGHHVVVLSLMRLACGPLFSAVSAGTSSGCSSDSPASLAVSLFDAFRSVNLAWCSRAVGRRGHLLPSRELLCVPKLGYDLRAFLCCLSAAGGRH